jgi:hypothetical protein
MIISLALLPLATQLVLTAADGVPQLNVRPSCEAAAKASSAIRSDLQTCLNSENQARDELAKQWQEFTPAERARCLQESTLGGDASYAELATCLEMARDVRKLPADKADSAYGDARRH